MIKAYHITRPAAFEEILVSGALIPIAMRVDPDVIERFCEVELQEYHGTVVGEMLAKVIGDFAKDRIKDLRQRIMVEPVASDPDMFHMTCFEFVAGGSDFVYLSPKRWEQRAIEFISGGRKWGFVFDAEDLIRRGAVVIQWRPQLFLEDELSSKPVTQLSEARTAVTNAFRRYKDNIMRGSKAMDWIRRGWGYVGWEGPLSISDALEIWKDGKRVKELEALIK